jgi:eukaryotic-like serine/threonine-protein kinase
MQIKKYYISPQFSFIPNTDLAYNDNPEAVGLLDKATEDVLILNPFITAFLKIFETASSLDDAVVYFSEDLKEPRNKVKSIVKAFFDDMIKRGILIEKQASTSSNEIIEIPDISGKKLGDYALLKRLSLTPPVEIYLAENALKKNFIVKRIVFAPNAPEKHIKHDRKLFSHEFKILKLLRHDASQKGVFSEHSGICQLIEFYPKSDYAVVEYFAGKSLWESIKEAKTTMSLAEKTKIWTQFLKSMAFIHSKGVLHGDLHYSNILINDQSTVRIIDFDLALHISELKNAKILTGGLKEFIPPERIQINAFDIVNNPPDFRAEVFQIGVLGYFLFFETLPFQAKTWKALAQSILNSEPSWDGEKVPLFIIELLKKALKKAPEQRFESAVEMYDVYAIISQN